MAEALVNSNEALAKITKELTAGATSVEVDKAAPEELWNKEFRCKIDKELILVTATGAKGVSPWTITRNVEKMIGGSGATSHPVGAEIVQELTAGAFEKSSLPASTGVSPALRRNSKGITEWDTLHRFDVSLYGLHPTNTATENNEAMTALAKIIEEAVQQCEVYFPANTENTHKVWQFSKNIVLPRNASTIKGEGRRGILKLTEDLPFGESFLSHGKTGAGPVGPYRYQDLALEGPLLWPTAPNKKEYNGYFPCYAMGLRVQGYSVIERCISSNFYADYLLMGTNFFFYECDAGTCLYCWYFGPQRTISGSGNEFGPLYIKWAEPNGNWAGIGTHPDNYILGRLENVDLVHCPYFFYREAPWGTRAYPQFTEDESMIGGGLQEGGNAFMLDEGAAFANEKPELEFTPGAGTVGLDFQYPNIQFNRANAVGNTQTLTITATGGTFTITIPANTTTGLIEATTAAINWNATNAEKESKIKAALSRGDVVVWTNPKGECCIQLLGYACLWGTAKMTVNASLLTGGTATLSEPYTDPGMGPLMRPSANTVKIAVEKATGGTFTLTFTVEGKEFTSPAIPFNASSNKVAEILSAETLSEIPLFNWVVAHSSINGTFTISFVGGWLNSTVVVTANTSLLVGAEAKVAIAKGEEGVMPLRQAQYTFDTFKGGFLSFIGHGPTGGMVADSEGYFRVAPEYLRVTENTAEGLVANAGVSKLIGTGTTIISELTLTTKSGYYIIGYLTTEGEVKKGTLLTYVGGAANVGSQIKVERYPINTAKGALAPPPAGYLGTTVTGPTYVPILVSSHNGILVEPDKAGLTSISAKVRLKPSTEEAGKITPVTDSDDLVVGVAGCPISGGLVFVVPKGMT